MINKYEERLGTERMLPLVFKMALPAVAAQFVNLLYSMVDGIYFGHIPGIGTDALAGVGGNDFSCYTDFFFFSDSRRWRCAVSGYRTRTGGSFTCRKNSG